MGHSFFLPFKYVVMQLLQNLCMQISTLTGSFMTCKQIGHLHNSTKASKAFLGIAVFGLDHLISIVLSLGDHTF